MQKSLTETEQIKLTYIAESFDKTSIFCRKLKHIHLLLVEIQVFG